MMASQGHLDVSGEDGNDSGLACSASPGAGCSPDKEVPASLKVTFRSKNKLSKRLVYLAFIAVSSSSNFLALVPRDHDLGTAIFS